MAITSSGYSLQVGVKVDTSSLRSQLDTFGTKYVLNIKANVTGLDQTSKLSANIKDISNSTNSVTASVGEATRATTTYTTRASSDYKKLQNTIEGAIQSQKSLGQVMIDQARTRAVTLAINEIIQAFQEAINIVKEFDDAVTEFKKVSDLSGESLDNYTKKLGELGETVARTRKLFCARMYSNVH